MHVTNFKKRARRAAIAVILLDALSASTYVQSQEGAPRFGDRKTPLKGEGSHC